MLKNKKFKYLEKKENAITLIALIVTIIVLLILAGVTMVTLTGEGGMLGKANAAALTHKKSKYFEEIKMEVSQEHIERSSKAKEEAFITSLQKRLNKKEWVQEELTIVCDSSNIVHSANEDYLNTVIIITTMENYEIFIDVDNTKYIATIRENTFISPEEKYTVVYVANAGNDTITGEVSNQEVRKGFYTGVKECEYQRTNYYFIGWCEDAQGNGTKYNKGESIQVNEDKTLYAIWKVEVYQMTIEPNGGTGESFTQNIDKTEPTITLPLNTYTTDSIHYFARWNTKQDGSGTSYNDGASITLTDDITLYAIWQEFACIITFDSNDDGQGKMEKQGVKTSGTSVKINPNAFTTDSTHFFTHWNTAKDGTGTSYGEEGTLTLSSSITLYAQWGTIGTPVYLYNAGTISSVAKDFKFARNSGSYGAGSLTKNATNLFFSRANSNNQWNTGGILSELPVDVTNYNTLTFYFDTGSKITSSNSKSYSQKSWVDLGLGTKAPSNSISGDFIDKKKKTLETPGAYNSTYNLESSYDIDISSIEGRYYIGLQTYNGYWSGQSWTLYVTGILLH